MSINLSDERRLREIHFRGNFLHGVMGQVLPRVNALEQ